MMVWGPGNAVTDTNLYRSAAGQLKTDGALAVGGNYTQLGGPLLQIRDSTGTNVRIMLHRDFTGADQPVVALYDSSNAERVRLGTNAVNGNAGIQLGPSGDTTLYRNGAGILRTDGGYQIGGSLGMMGQNSFLALQALAGANTLAYVTAAPSVGAYNLFTINANGKMFWGPGTTSQDTTLTRGVAGQLVLTNSLAIANVGNQPTAVPSNVFGLSLQAGNNPPYAAGGGNGWLWVNTSGGLSYMGTNGTITQLAPA
jgi:hypothetical protein